MSGHFGDGTLATPGAVFHLTNTPILPDVARLLEVVVVLLRVLGSLAVIGPEFTGERRDLGFRGGRSFFGTGFLFHGLPGFKFVPVVASWRPPVPEHAFSYHNLTHAPSEL